jgi:predicted ATPase/DNA-binding winged helix-turn-helix (wHTH) protein
MFRLSNPPAIIEFGHFRIFPHRRQLLADGRPIRLGGRAFDVLMALIEASGAVVSKDELLDRVWQGRIVDENRLAGEIAALRKAFNVHRELIRTVTGRGYQFTGEIRLRSKSADGETVREGTAAAAAPRSTRTNLPEPVSELIGREAEVADVTDLVTTHRLVTLIGAGGIGKTRLGLEVARHMVEEFADGVWVAELAPLSDPDLVPVTVAMALGLDLSGGAASAERVANALAAKRFMLLLDNCEHVIDAVANMTAALLRANSAARVLATSREPLRTDGEYLYRVPSLTVPVERSLDIDELLRHGAVRLFVARARAADPRFSPEGRVATATATICRRLDGIPLAIELAAARGAVLGTAEVASRLDDRFDLLTNGQRTALPRHQTLRATLDWSYELLPEPERLVLRRLAVFAGSFTLAAASTVAAGGPINASDVVDCVAKLITKSLVTTDANGSFPHHRMLETTRAYALERLFESGEADVVARRHADYYRQLLERTEADKQIGSAPQLVAAYRHEIDNLRAALDWAFAPSGEASIGVALTIACVPTWSQMSLMEECRRRVERALASSATVASLGARGKMLLYAALGASLMQTKGPVPETNTAWAHALELAERLDNTEHQLRSLWGLWVYRFNTGEHRAALALAERFCCVAAMRADPADQLIGDRMTSSVLHYLGNQADARLRIERMVDRYVSPAHRSHTVRYQFDQSVLARGVRARILWVQGYSDQAVRTVQRGVEDALALEHALSLCNVLAEAACPLAYLVGHVGLLEHFLTLLLEYSGRLGLTFWQAWGRVFEGMLLIAQGDAAGGSRILRTALNELRETRFELRYTSFLGLLAEGLGRASEEAQGIIVINEALEIAERHEERWCIAELLRVKGELVLLEGSPDAATTADDHFHQALDWARRQGALSWELRAATSLARLLSDHSRSADAIALLQPVYDRFTEGFDTADVKAAKALLDALAEPAGSAKKVPNVPRASSRA